MFILFWAGSIINEEMMALLFDDCIGVILFLVTCYPNGSSSEWKHCDSNIIKCGNIRTTPVVKIMNRYCNY